MKVGDYVRTKDYLGNQLINKIKKVYDDGCIHTDKGYWDNEHIIKSSPNILELLEEHDVLKLFDKEYGLEYKAEVLLDEEGYKHISNYECSDLLNLEWELISGEHVKILSIVTKEQFESMEYKIC